MREQTAVLRDVPDTTAQRDGIDGRDVVAIHQHAAGVGIDEAIEGPQQRALSGAALADEGETATGVDGDGDGVERDDIAESLADLLRP